MDGPNDATRLSTKLPPKPVERSTYGWDPMTDPTSGRGEGSGTARPASVHALELGGCRLTYLPDGYYSADAMEQFPGTAQPFWCAHPEVLQADGLLVMSVGAILVESNGLRILIDTGTGPRDLDVAAATGGAFRGRLVGGDLLESLATVGLNPSQIDHIVYSHLHIDHTGWLLDDLAQRVFPRATYHVSDEELEFWSQPSMIAGGHGPGEAELAVLRTSRGPLPAEAGIELWPTPGHTPGHVSVAVQAGDGSAIVLGDAFHCPLELVNDGLDFVTDADVDAARRSRAQVLDWLAAPDRWFAGAHFPTEVFGQVGQRDSDRFLTYPQR
jgi:glyoxylase-like metal-dependent hydrolase (beta-lactamase superfamily II)